MEITERVRLAGVGNLLRTVFDHWLLTFSSFDKTAVKDTISLNFIQCGSLCVYM